MLIDFLHVWIFHILYRWMILFWLWLQGRLGIGWHHVWGLRGSPHHILNCMLNAICASICLSLYGNTIWEPSKCTDCCVLSLMRDNARSMETKTSKRGHRTPYKLLSIIFVGTAADRLLLHIRIVITDNWLVISECIWRLRLLSKLFSLFGVSFLLHQLGNQSLILIFMIFFWWTGSRLRLSSWLTYWCRCLLLLPAIIILYDGRGFFCLFFSCFQLLIDIAMLSLESFLVLFHLQLLIYLFLLLFLKLGELPQGFPLLKFFQKLALAIVFVFFKFSQCNILIALKTFLCFTSTIFLVFKQLITGDY